MKIRVQRFTQVHKAVERDSQPAELIVMFQAVLPSVMLLDENKVRPDHRIPGTSQGYQRQLTPSRVSSIARYVKGGGGIMPTAVLLNVREGAEFIPDSPGSSHGVLDIPDDQVLWVTDGQHRLGGLRDVARNPGPVVLANYEVPVVLTTLSYEEELQCFYTVNKEARNVPTDLTAELLEEIGSRKIAFGEKITAQHRRKTLATYIAKRLAVESGPWAGKIRLAEEDKSLVKQKAVGVSAFGATLRPALMDPWMRRQFEGTTGEAPQVDSPGWREIYEVTRNYWLAIVALMPEAAADRARYSLQKPLGAYVFNEIMPEFLDLARRAGDFSPEFFRTELERLGEWVETPQWDTAGDVREPIVKANNRQAIEYIVGQMRQALRDVPSEQVTEVVLPTGGAAAPEANVFA